MVSRDQDLTPAMGPALWPWWLPPNVQAEKEPEPLEAETHFPPMTSIASAATSCTVSGWPCEERRAQHSHVACRTPLASPELSPIIAPSPADGFVGLSGHSGSGDLQGPAEPGPAFRVDPAAPASLSRPSRWPRRDRRLGSHHHPPASPQHQG